MSIRIFVCFIFRIMDFHQAVILLLIIHVAVTLNTDEVNNSTEVTANYTSEDVTSPVNVLIKDEPRTVEAETTPPPAVVEDVSKLVDAHLQRFSVDPFAFSPGGSFTASFNESRFVSINIINLPFCLHINLAYVEGRCDSEVKYLSTSPGQFPLMICS